jgi:hypothetical protein
MNWRLLEVKNQKLIYQDQVASMMKYLKKHNKNKQARKHAGKKDLKKLLKI